VTRSEAGQCKALLVLESASGWKEVDSLPLDLGPRHFSPAPAELAELLQGQEGVRSGDR
jgi:hypothetical protein